MAKIAIIGTGLIGTSLALALKEARIKNLELVGTDYDSSARSGAVKKKAFDRVENRLTAAVRDADIVIVATPVMAMQDLLSTIAPELPDGCVVTDVGSSKKSGLGMGRGVFAQKGAIRWGSPHGRERNLWTGNG